jgi:hypothetical protein
MVRHITDGLVRANWKKNSTSPMANMVNTWQWEERCDWVGTLKRFGEYFREIEAGLKAHGRELFHVEQESAAAAEGA